MNPSGSSVRLGIDHIYLLTAYWFQMLGYMDYMIFETWLCIIVRAQRHCPQLHDSRRKRTIQQEKQSEKQHVQNLQFGGASKQSTWKISQRQLRNGSKANAQLSEHQVESLRGRTDDSIPANRQKSPPAFELPPDSVNTWDAVGHFRNLQACICCDLRTLTV